VDEVRPKRRASLLRLGGLFDGVSESTGSASAHDPDKLSGVDDTSFLAHSRSVLRSAAKGYKETAEAAAFEEVVSSLEL
jgi:hypothetical protein